MQDVPLGDTSPRGVMPVTSLVIPRRVFKTHLVTAGTLTGSNAVADLPRQLFNVLGFFDQ